MLRIDNLPLSDQAYIQERIKMDQTFRIQYCEHDKKVFAIFYFGKLMTHGIPGFHNDYYDWAQSGKNLCLIGYRGCAKTAIFGLIDIIHDIVYKKESFIVFLAYNKTDSSGKLRNIVTALKTNKLITNDFGFLFENEKSGKKNLKGMPESKSVSKFITTNSIRVEAFSMDQAARGFVFYDDEGEFIRPSKVIADDVAVLANSKNKDIVDKDFKFLTEELLGGVKGRIVFLLNAVSEYCITSKLKTQFEYNDNWIFNEKAIIENDVLTWPEKYVWTTKEARKYNQGKHKRLHVESIEEFKSRGIKSFEVNYMNIPDIIVGDPVFDIDLLQAISPKPALRKIILTVNKKRFELFIYKETKVVSAGVDVANGGGGDNSSITLLDDIGELVAQGASNEIEPYELAYLVKAIHYNLKYIYFKNCLVIEKNNSGIAVVQELRHDKYLYRLIYRKRLEAKIKDVPTNELGFPTTESSKEILKGELDKKLENRKLDLSFYELHEFKRFIYNDKGKMTASPGEKDDRVISRGLALMGLLYKK